VQDHAAIGGVLGGGEVEHVKDPFCHESGALDGELGDETLVGQGGEGGVRDGHFGCFVGRLSCGCDFGCEFDCDFGCGWC
jgi:hypothetical protein